MIGNLIASEPMQMTHFLATKDNPDGYRLEILLDLLRADLTDRMTKISRDPRPEARKVFTNDVQILDCLTTALARAEENSKLLHQAFGPSQNGQPRIGD